MACREEGSRQVRGIERGGIEGRGVWREEGQWVVDRRGCDKKGG